MFRHIILITLVMFFTACQKNSDSTPAPAANTGTSDEFVKFTIKKGEQYSDKNGFKSIETSELKFIARFDSSAIYQTTDPANQFDINKLYGFADNNTQHHLFSARIGWRWSENALRLFGYVYNNGAVSYKELKTINIGADVSCSIKTTETAYVFTVNNTIDSLPRTATTKNAKGYFLYPYFGGDESAPHDVVIRIRDL